MNKNFAEKVELIPFSECALWAGSVDKDGYGRFSHKRAHRFQWEQHYGPIPDGLCVLHKCNQGHLGCVSIDHLKLGTNADNMKDKAEAGSSKGERNGRARINARIAQSIREQYESGGKSQQRIADEFGISQSLVSLVILNEIWE